MNKNSSKSTKYTYSVGRRKSAIARVRLFKGNSENLVNAKVVKDVFYEKPFIITETQGKFYFTSVVKGGGLVSQKEAVVHGLSRALSKYDPEKYRSVLKKAKLLTRDPRERLRRMVGMGGKARRRKQSPKR